MKAAIIVLILLSLGLGVGLLVRHNNAVKIDTVRKADIVTFSNRLVETSAKLDEQERMTLFLETNKVELTRELLSTSNTLFKTSADLAKARNDAQAAAEAAKAEMAKRDARINELETQRDDLTKKMDGLTLDISNLGKQIADTEQKLAASEGDREFLLKELKRMQTEKAELERQFNDLSLLRTQVAKLKEELSIARRLEWIRMGIYGTQEKKGAEMLMSPVIAGTTKPAYNLNVELKQDGAATVITNSTNPTSNPAPPK
jgi:chromosome segregation ATPase